MTEEAKERWIVGKLLEDPDYRPYCMNCSTMERLTLRHDRKTGQRTMTCDEVYETHPGAMALLQLGAMPRKGCGGSYDVDTGEFIRQPRKDCATT